MPAPQHILTEEHFRELADIQEAATVLIPECERGQRCGMELGDILKRLQVVLANAATMRREYFPDKS